MPTQENDWAAPLETAGAPWLTWWKAATEETIAWSRAAWDGGQQSPRTGLPTLRWPIGPLAVWGSMSAAWLAAAEQGVRFALAQLPSALSTASSAWPGALGCWSPGSTGGFPGMGAGAFAPLSAAPWLPPTWASLWAVAAEESSANAEPPTD